jgi:enoyl-CoA hydratase/carnithine racemase
MTYEWLTIEHDGPITHIWLNRPEQLNALNPRALEEITAVFVELQSRFETQVVVLGGRGTSFSAGVDRKDPQVRMFKGSGAGPRERRWVSQTGLRVIQAVEQVEAVTIVRLHGYVIGGAVLLALACDLRVAAESAVFQIPEVDLGIPLTWGGVPRLIHEVGAAKAKELILLGDRFDARTAERYGIVNRVVPDPELDVAVDEWARRLAAKAPGAVHMTKTQFRAYSRITLLGEVAEADGDLLVSASSEDPSRFVFSERK